MKSQSSSLGKLVLLGSEGVSDTIMPLWNRLLGNHGGVQVVALPAETPSMVFRARIELLEAMLSKLGSSYRTGDADLALHAISTDNEPGPLSVIVSAEKPTRLPAGPNEMGHERIGDSKTWYSQLVATSAQVIVGAAAASSLGTNVIDVSRPLPRNPGEVTAEMTLGSGLFEACMVLPYFDQLLPATLSQIVKIAGEHLLIGIDQDSALVIDSAEAHVVGFGKLTLLRDNEVIWAGRDGDTAPAGLITLSLATDNR